MGLSTGVEPLRVERGLTSSVGLQGLAALFTLVAVGAVVTTRRAGALDVPVGEELLGFFVVELLLGFHLKPALVEQREEEILRHFVVLGRGGAAVVVEADVEACEGFLHLHVVRVHDFSGVVPSFFHEA